MKLQIKDDFNKKNEPEDITVGEYNQECIKSKDEDKHLGELEALRLKLNKSIKFNGDLIDMLIKKGIISEDDAFNLTEIEGSDMWHSYWKNGRKIKTY